MSINSMTGFARTEGHVGPYGWVWEIRSVNGKGLDIRSRLANGFEAFDPEVRARIQAAFARGSFQVSLAVKREEGDLDVRINQVVLSKMLQAMKDLSLAVDLSLPRPESILALRGVLEVGEPEEDEAQVGERNATLLVGLEAAVADLAVRRAAEGAQLAEILNQSLTELSGLIDAAHAAAEAQVPVLRDRLSAQIADLLAPGTDIPADRLAQEVALMAARADVREEIDRLRAHVVAARELLADPKPVGRKLDFLMQEFNREANTVCSKSTDVALTRVGLDLKALIGQMREQVQNIE